ncbi:g11619 [Coccomyxa elongata]
MLSQCHFNSNGLGFQTISRKRQMCPARPALTSNGGPSLQSGQTPQELLRVFEETQRNMMDLNKKRLAALAEVKTLRARVAKLDAKVAALEQDANGGKTPFDAPVPALHEEPGAYVPQASTAQQGPTITITYQTGWNRAFLHYNVDGKGWTQVPGEEMLPGTGDLAGLRVKQVVGNRVEFVINNTEGGWDTPDPSTGSKNYVIDAPGRYHLKSGKIVQMA